LNIGLLNNFVSALKLATGDFFRWVGDDDWLAPTCVSRSLDVFEADSRLLLVTTQVEYLEPDGHAQSALYQGTALGSDDPITRFCEMLRLLNESRLMLDIVYGLFRREAILNIERRNMLREDQVYATKLALAGPWGHVPEVLARRYWKDESAAAIASKLEIPAWRAHIRVVLQCRELLRWLDKCELDPQQRRRAQWRASNLPDCGPNRVRFGKESRSGTKIREIQARVS
jgi:hypothetical protein